MRVAIDSEYLSSSHQRIEQVRRGPKWRFNDQDGHGLGEVMHYDGVTHEVHVRWTTGLLCSYTYDASGDHYEVQLVDPSDTSALPAGQVLPGTTVRMKKFRCKILIVQILFNFFFFFEDG